MVLRFIFIVPCRVKNNFINIPEASPLVEVLLYMSFGIMSIGNNVIVHYNIIKFYRVFMPVKYAIDHRFWVSIELITSFSNIVINLLSYFFNIFNITCMVKSFPCIIAISNPGWQEVITSWYSWNIEIMS